MGFNSARTASTFLGRSGGEKRCAQAEHRQIHLTQHAGLAAILIVGQQVTQCHRHILLLRGESPAVKDSVE